MILRIVGETYIFGQLFDYKASNFIGMMQTTSLSRHQNIEVARKNFRHIIESHQELYE